MNRSELLEPNVYWSKFKTIISEEEVLSVLRSLFHQPIENPIDRLAHVHHLIHEKKSQSNADFKPELKLPLRSRLVLGILTGVSDISQKDIIFAMAKHFYYCFVRLDSWLEPDLKNIWLNTLYQAFLYVDALMSVRAFNNIPLGTHSGKEVYVRIKNEKIIYLNDQKEVEITQADLQEIVTKCNPLLESESNLISEQKIQIHKELLRESVQKWLPYIVKIAENRGHSISEELGLAETAQTLFEQTLNQAEFIQCLNYTPWGTKLQPHEEQLFSLFGKSEISMKEYCSAIVWLGDIHLAPSDTIIPAKQAIQFYYSMKAQAWAHEIFMGFLNRDESEEIKKPHLRFNEGRVQWLSFVGDSGLLTSNPIHFYHRNLVLTDLRNPYQHQLLIAYNPEERSITQPAPSQRQQVRRRTGNTSFKKDNINRFITAFNSKWKAYEKALPSITTLYCCFAKIGFFNKGQLPKSIVNQVANYLVPSL